MTAAGFLAACQLVQPSAPKPSPTIVQPRTTPTLKSEDIRTFYARLEQDQITRGLLRKGGGGPDTPYDADTLARNFERIAFSVEYSNVTSLAPQNARPVSVKKWAKPVRVQLHFGPSVPMDQKQRDRASVSHYVQRLAALTRHPISMVATNGNFHVMVLSEDDRPAALPRIRRILPGIDSGTMNVIRTMDHMVVDCLVVPLPDPTNPDTLYRAVAVVRAEHPDLKRLACFHEEIAQGLGLSNDSPSARPSIFNDDSEFALLTSHDEKLLKILYDPRLRPGQTAAQARPVVRILAREAMGRIY